MTLRTSGPVTRIRHAARSPQGLNARTLRRTRRALIALVCLALIGISGLAVAAIAETLGNDSESTN